MKRIVSLLAILITLGTLYYFMIQQDQSQATPQFSDREIAYKEFDNVDKIFIRERNKEGRFIKRKGDRWYFEDSVLISKVYMGNLERVITLPTVKYIPIGNEKKLIKTSLNQIGIEVKLFDKENNILRDYWVGRNTNNEDGTAYLVNGADQPYMMEIPFSRGTLRGLFLFKPGQIRDKSIATYQVGDITQVKINYPKNTDSSFALDKHSDGDYTVTPLYPSSSVEQRSLNAKAVDNFLIEFKQFYSETYETGNPNSDKITSAVPFMICDITLADGTSESYKFWPFSNILTNDIDPESQKSLKMVERFFVETNNDDLYIVQHRIYQNLMVTYNFFYL